MVASKAEDFFIHPQQWEVVKTLAEKMPLVDDGETILITGANGQVGKLLEPFLKELYGDKVIVSDINVKDDSENGVYNLDVIDSEKFSKIVEDNNVKAVLNLAALLSAASENNPELAEQVNEVAPRNNAEISKKLGVRLFFNASSIAAQEVGEDVHFANISTPDKTKGKYGVAKKEIEDFFENLSDDKFSAVCLRYAGVLACNLPASDGTTEEVDKLINYIAIKNIEKKYPRGEFPDLNWEAFDKQKEIYEKNSYISEGKYYPKVEANTEMPFASLQTIVAETIKFLHMANSKELNAKIEEDKESYKSPIAIKRTGEESQRIQNPDKRKQRYFISEFGLSIKKTLKILKDKVGDLKVDFSKTDGNKVKFSKLWAGAVNALQSVRDWGMRRPNTAKESVNERYKTKYAELEKILVVEKKKEKKPESRLEGNISVGSVGSGVYRVY